MVQRSLSAVLTALVTVSIVTALWFVVRFGIGPDTGQNSHEFEAARGNSDRVLIAERGAGEQRGPGAPGASRERGKESEVEYLRRLRSLAGRDPEAAVALSDQGEQWFAGGQLVEERRAIAINALVRLGRMGEARARTRALIRSFPGGRFTRLAKGMTGVHPRPAGPDRELEW